MQTERQVIAEPQKHLAHPLPIETGLQWGSDPSFQYHGFSSPIGSCTEERLVRDLMRNVAFMCHIIDIDLNTKPEIPQVAHQEPFADEWSFLDDLELPSQSDISSMGLSVSSPSPDLEIHPKSTSPRSTSTPSTRSLQKRKPSTTSTSTRKRKCVQRPGQALCHCQAERKRRETIGHGYESLSQVVPALRGQSFTRKYVLEGAANYVQHLIDGNRVLQQQLDDIKAKRDGLI